MEINKTNNSLAIFEQVKENSRPSSSRNIKKIRKKEDDRATGFGAAIIKRKFHNSVNDNDVEDDPLYIVSTPKKKHKDVKRADEPINVKCEWNNCNVSFDCNDKFTNHVNSHSWRVETKCKWTNCSHSIEDKTNMERHMDFHIYHTKLKNIGENVRTRLDLPPCLLEPVDIFPDLKKPYYCLWDNCNFKLNLYQMYVSHVRCHVIGKPEIVMKGTNKLIRCCWEGCKSAFRMTYSLDEHVRTHTREKLIACPACGQTFASKTKFSDHCQRQETVSDESYQCSQCLKLFPSERLLRNHIRLHVNNYKCQFCDMTCTVPAALARHISYRHLTEKPIKCDYCQHRTVNQTDMNRHIKTHSILSRFKCSECSAKYRSSASLKYHYRKTHQELPDVKLYACHCCSERFVRGASLTIHLIKHHDFQWPSGHSRFRYKQDPADGLYRIQTIRYESIEVTQEMIKEQSQESPIQRHYNLRRKKNQITSATSDVVITSCDSEVIDNNLVQMHNDIVITVDELDEKGNVIKSKIINTNEICIAQSSVN